MGTGITLGPWPEESIQVAFSLHHRHHPSTTTDDDAKTNFGFSVDRENERRRWWGTGKRERERARFRIRLDWEPLHFPCCFFLIFSLVRPFFISARPRCRFSALSLGLPLVVHFLLTSTHSLPLCAALRCPKTLSLATIFSIVVVAVVAIRFVVKRRRIKRRRWFFQSNGVAIRLMAALHRALYNSSSRAC